MSTCEKCWVDSYDPYTGHERYFELSRERTAAGRQCTPEEQAGPGAEQCPACQRMSLHQYTREPMCGCPRATRQA